MRKKVAPIEPEDEVAERGEQGGASGSEGDQGVSRQRRDLQEDEDVEHVSGDRHAEHPGEAQQPRGVEEPDALAADLARNAEPGVHQRQGARAGHDHQHQGVQRVEPVLDAPRRRPSSEEIGDLRAVRHRAGERRRDREAHPAHRRGESPGEGGIAQQRAQRRREKRHDDLQRGKLRLQGAHRRPASLSPARCSRNRGTVPVLGSWGPLGARASRPQAGRKPATVKAGGTPASRRDAPLPGRASVGEAPSRQPPACNGQGTRCPKSPRLRRVAGGTPAIPRDAPLPGSAEPEPTVRS